MSRLQPVYLEVSKVIIDAMLCAELQRIVNCPISHIERYAEFILSKMDEAGCSEFMVSPVDETLQIVLLRMGYEADEIGLALHLE